MLRLCRSLFPNFCLPVRRPYARTAVAALHLFGQRFSGGDAIAAAHIVMGDETNRVGTDGAGEDAARLQPRDQFRLRSERSGQPEDDDVGFDRMEIDGDAIHVR